MDAYNQPSMISSSGLNLFLLSNILISISFLFVGYKKFRLK